MTTRTTKAHLLRTTLLAALAASPVFIGSAFAQETPAAPQPVAESGDVVVITGTRVTTPGVVSSSQIASVGEAEIDLLQQPEVEKIIRLLPMTVPADGQNVNNGTDGAATLNLRGLGAKRNLVLLDGQRITPFDFQSEVDTQVIPTALLERIDIITGGASATYGSDAMSGAVNFITKRDFEGVDIDAGYSVTGEDDGQIYSTAVTLGSNIADGRGNVVFSANYSKREGVQGGARPLGRLGVATADGAGYDEFLAGQPPALPEEANCQAENAVDDLAGGSTTTTPTRLAIFGGPGLGQVRTDNTIGGDCSTFNFNPYNYYQTPQSASALLRSAISLSTNISSPMRGPASARPMSASRWRLRAFSPRHSGRRSPTRSYRRSSRPSSSQLPKPAAQQRIQQSASSRPAL